MIWLRGVLFTGALAFLVLTFVNASWLVTAPPGRPRLIANGGIAQDYQPGGRQAPCPARAILPPLHPILEDTARAVFTARRMGADYVAIDVVRTADNHLALFPDADLGCRTEASGPASQKTMAQLAGLDVGLALRVGAAACVTAAFTMFVADYAERRSALVHAGRELNMTEPGRLAMSSLGRAVAHESTVAAAVAAAASLVGAAAPLLFGALVPVPAWITLAIAVALHPGTVDTRLSEPFQANLPQGQLMTAKASAAHLLDLAGRLGREHSGRHLAWDGSEIPG